MIVSEMKMEEKEAKIKEIIDNFSSLIRSVIQKTVHDKDNIDFEDIEQEIKIKIWKFIAKGKNIEKLSSYIQKVAYTVTIDELRKMRKQTLPRRVDELKKVYSFSQNFLIGQINKSPEFFFEKKELKMFLREAVDSLNGNRKQVLRLYMKGMSIEEISQLFDWDKAKVRHLLYRGIDAIKEKIKSDKKNDIKKSNCPN